MGGAAPPAQAPSLFHASPRGVLSELYLTNGSNQLSWVEGDEQLLWESRFAPPEPEYYKARLAALRPNVPLAEPPRAIFGRLAAAFRATPPLSGAGAPRLTLWRWDARESRRGDDPNRATEMARHLAEAWSRFVPAELPPTEEAARWVRPAPQAEGEKPARAPGARHGRRGPRRPREGTHKGRKTG